jgi:V8-like Glu-specific endopeptidase
MTHRSPTRSLLTHRHPRPYRARLAVLVAVSCLLGAAVSATTVAAAAASAAAEPLREPTGSTAAHAPHSTAFGGTPRVGALFFTGDSALSGDFCTAAVVAAPGHDLLVTAAHCVVTPGSGKVRGNLMFVPGYVSGQAPYGRWAVRKVVVDTRWARRGDPDYDVAFLITAPIGSEGRVQDVVGAEGIAFTAQPARPAPVPAVAVGYPWHGGQPVHCRSQLLRHSSSQLRFDCPGMPMGTSGSPLLSGVDATGSGPGRVLGVIGGYQSGGATDDISYSPSFGPGIEALYRSAVAQG